MTLALEALCSRTWQPQSIGELPNIATVMRRSLPFSDICALVDEQLTLFSSDPRSFIANLRKRILTEPLASRFNRPLGAQTLRLLEQENCTLTEIPQSHDALKRMRLLQHLDSISHLPHHRARLDMKMLLIDFEFAKSEM